VLDVVYYIGVDFVSVVKLDEFLVLGGEDFVY